MKIGKVAKPTFIEFRKEFLMQLENTIGTTVQPYEDSWHEFADKETRERIIKEFIRNNEQKYGFEIVLKAPLSELKSSIEGVIGELYHVFSTMFLVEVINSKIRSGERYVEI